jgi:ABC-type multidrug transport system ATPase subunit
LTVRQTLEFALKNKTPKKLLPEVPRFLHEFGRVFGMTHVMDTLVGNEFIRGISGGERKRLSILESLASESSINCWDGSTRGLDAASALDYIRSLRIMTDTCDRATIVSIYQASDAIYELMDKLLLIDEGRMLYQGPARDAESYFNALGYYRRPRQTMSDFLSSVAAGNPENIREEEPGSTPRGAVNLERVFKSSKHFDQVQADISAYETSKMISSGQTGDNSMTPIEAFREYGRRQKSRFVSSRSPYNTSFLRQTVLCTQRELWQLRGHTTPFLTKMFCLFVSTFLLGSMFYKMPVDTAGVFSRGGFAFYAAALVAWFQISELEKAFFDRTVVSRQRRFAMVRPGAVVLGKMMVDVLSILFQSFMFSIIAYFLAGMRYQVRWKTLLLYGYDYE